MRAPKIEPAVPARWKNRLGLSSIAVFLLTAALVLYVGLPVAALFLRSSVDGFVGALADPVVQDSLKLSLLTSVAATLLVVVIGTPVAYVNARCRYPGKELIDTIVDLPVVLPPAVAGIALLVAFGRRGLVGQYLSGFGITLAFTTVAVVMAQTFVASPFFIRQARTSFEDVDRSYENAARTLGASPVKTFFYVTVPIALNGLISGAILTWARALGEFGATILFAGNLEGKTQTMPLAIYTAMEGSLDTSVYISVILVIISFGVIAAIKILSRRKMIHAQD